MRDFIDMKWGTPEPISLRDKDLGLARLRAFGSYSMAVTDPQLFVTKIVGTQGLYQTSQIAGLPARHDHQPADRSSGRDQGRPVRPAGLFDEMSAARADQGDRRLRCAGHRRSSSSIIQSISPTEETQKAIDERASMGAIGDMNRYMQFKAARAMGDAASGGWRRGNAAGTGVGLGAGLGMGAGLAGMVSQAIPAHRAPAESAARRRRRRRPQPQQRPT